jgi:hypothetical protein
MRILRLARLATALALPLSLSAHAQVVQNPPDNPHTLNHGEVAAFGDYLRFAPPGHGAVNFVGLGGRVGVNVHPNLALEAEMAYDFERNFTTVGTNGGTTTTVVTGVRPLTGLFGPKIQFGTSGPFRAFLTGKAGFLEMSTSNKGPSTDSFGNAFDQFGGSGTHFAAYPGGGIEAFLGPIGLRAEVGDEIYLNNGANNNLRITVGPSIRF